MKPFKILVIDDDPEQAEILDTILQAEGREIKVCTSGKEALQIIQQSSYDLIFTDISMPDVDGIQILKFAKQNSPKTEVVPITAFGDWGIYAEALRLGAKEFINKPYDIPEIQGVVERIASGRVS